MFSKFFNVFKVPKHKKFKFKPRFYDADKEALLERIDAAKKEVEVENRAKSVEAKEEIRQKFDELRDKRKMRGELQQNNRRLIIIIAVLLMLFYWLLR